jgi:predicted Zn-dependent protease
MDVRVLFLPSRSFLTVQRLRTSWGRRRARVSALYLGAKAYLIYGTAKSEKRSKQLAKRLHMGVMKIRKGQTLSSLAKRTPLPDYPEQTLRLINDRYPDGKLQTGEEIELTQ